MKQHKHRTTGHHSPTYISWKTMRQRCWKGYTTYDPRWDAFRVFLEDMGERPDGTTLDRIDGTRGYFKDNVRWATATQQARNRKSNRVITYDGLSLIAVEWDERQGFRKGTVSCRLAKGWDEVRAITQPVRKFNDL